MTHQNVKKLKPISSEIGVQSMLLNNNAVLKKCFSINDPLREFELSDWLKMVT